MIVATPRTTRGKSNDPINVLRFVAALAVVVSHLRTLFFVDYSGADSTDPVTQALYLAGSLGHSAVIIFFVLSGFWVGGSVLRSSGDAKFDVGVYAISRLTRLWIVLVPAIVLTQVLDRFGMLAFPKSDIYNARQNDYHSVVPTGGPSEHLDLPTTLGNFLFLQPHHVSALGTNTALWSLAYEFWYYLLFPAAVLAFSATLKNRWRVMAGVVFLLGSLVAGPSILALFPVWLMGAALSALGDPLKSKLSRLPPKLLVSIRWGFGAGLLCACALTVRFELNEYLSAGIVGTTATLYIATLILGSRPETPSGRLTRPLARASEWSYSLYAVHLPLLAFIAAWLIPDAKARWQMSPSSIMAAAAIVALVCLGAVAMYWISERHTFRVRNVLVKRLKGAQSDRR